MRPLHPQEHREGLEQEFNSLDAQREAGEVYVRSQPGEGWTCLPERYDDGAFTGGNMDRPALRRLLADVEAGKVDAVVVYKVDRLSRSLLDFARMMATFETHRVSFVSVTQQLNTATSMGRLAELPRPHAEHARLRDEAAAGLLVVATLERGAVPRRLRGGRWTSCCARWRTGRSRRAAATTTWRRVVVCYPFFGPPEMGVPSTLRS